MDTKELLKKVRSIDVRTRGLVNHIFGGEYHSVFKGRGMSFSEVREYQWGDEVRLIDWNVSARFDRPYIKVFEEEREQTLMILFDVSASNQFGAAGKTKIQLMVELVAVLAFSAIKNHDKVGLLFFTDRVEKYIAPKKGRAHVLRLIRELIAFRPDEAQTRLTPALEYVFHVLKRRSILFIVSDFIDDGYDKALKALARKHDVIAVRVSDPRERHLPPIGLVTFEDEETQRQITVDTASADFQKNFCSKTAAIAEQQNRLFDSARVDRIDLFTDDNYIQSLMRFFKYRSKRLTQTIDATVDAKLK